MRIQRYNGEQHLTAVVAVLVISVIFHALTPLGSELTSAWAESPTETFSTAMVPPPVLQ